MKEDIHSFHIRYISMIGSKRLQSYEGYKPLPKTPLVNSEARLLGHAYPFLPYVFCDFPGGPRWWGCTRGLHLPAHRERHHFRWYRLRPDLRLLRGLEGLLPTQTQRQRWLQRGGKIIELNISWYKLSTLRCSSSWRKGFFLNSKKTFALNYLYLSSM